MELANDSCESRPVGAAPEPLPRTVCGPMAARCSSETGHVAGCEFVEGYRPDARNCGLARGSANVIRFLPATTDTNCSSPTVNVTGAA